jgi:hypothetical protein
MRDMLMAASMIRAYNPYVDNSRYTGVSENKAQTNTATVEKLSRTNDVEPTAKVEHYSDFNPEELITREERDFFKSMFPESTQKIEEHILFNRNGSAQHISVNKGILLDSRI